MRDLLSKPKIVAHVAGDSSTNNLNFEADAVKSRILVFLNDDICGAILDTSFPRMLKKEKVHPGVAFSVGALELWSDDIASIVQGWYVVFFLLFLLNHFIPFSVRFFPLSFARIFDGVGPLDLGSLYICYSYLIIIYF